MSREFGICGEIVVSGGGGGDSAPWGFPAMPAPLFDDGLTHVGGSIIPHKGTLIDSVELPSTITSSYVGRLGASTIWSVAPGDLDASVDGYICIYSNWYDSINDRLYVFGVDSGTAPDTFFTAFITLETGAVTSVGSTQLSADAESHTFTNRGAVSRTAIDSGSFTLNFLDRRIVISDIDGSEISNVAIVPRTTEGLPLPGNYATLDGTMFLSRIGGINDLILLVRNNLGYSVAIPHNLLMGETTRVEPAAMGWGDKVKIFNKEAFPINIPVPRTFLRADFDAWLQKVADYIGLT